MLVHQYVSNKQCLAIAKIIRLTIILMLSCPAPIHGQEENIGNLFLDADTTAIKTEFAVGGFLLNSALNSAGAAFNTLVDTAKNNFGEPAIDEPKADSTVTPAVGGDPSINPATSGQSTVEQTNGLLKNPGEVTTKPSLNPLSDPPESETPVDIELSVTGDRYGKPTLRDPECDPNKSQTPTGGSSCDQPTPQIIWPSGCADSTPIKEALVQAGVKSETIRTSEDDCGTYFLTAPMTNEQISRVDIVKSAIEAIVPDEYAISSGSGTSKPSRRKKKRQDEDQLVRVYPAPDHLHAISSRTPLNARRPAPRDYWYPENAGQSINGYLLLLADTRMESNNPEFKKENIIKSYDFALTPVDETGIIKLQVPGPGSALSLVSLVSGQMYGVSKKASLNLIMLSPTTSSFLDGLKKVQESLRRKNALARTVVMTPIGFETPSIFNLQTPKDPRFADGINEAKALGLVRILIDEFQVVFVCAAGDIKANSDGTSVKEPYQWPATWASKPDSPPIIVVGGVDQTTGLVAKPDSSISPLTGSVSGPSVTLYAPYFAFADSGQDFPPRTGGTGPSTAMATGLAMDFLSRQEIRLQLELSKNEARISDTSTALKIRRLMMDKSCPRISGGPSVIWNGIDSGLQREFRLNDLGSPGI